MALIEGNKTTATDDTLTSTGDDTLKGYAGNDTYVVDSYKDYVVEAANAGDDTISFTDNYDVGKTTSYVLAANVEDLTLSDWDLTSNTTFSSSKRFLIKDNALANIITLGDNNGSKVKILAAAGDDTVYGSSGDDYIDGGKDNDFIYGYAGRDTLLGGLGNDWLDGDEGLNSLDGGAGDDTLVGGIAADVLYGGIGNDSIFAGDGDNKINAGAGNDTIIGGADNDSVLSSSGNNYIDVGNGKNIINSGSGNDTIYAGAGDDSIISLAGNNYIDAGDGLNVIKTGKGQDTIIGGADIDSIISSSGNNYIEVYAGNDIINSGAGSDTIYAGEGDDSIISLAGNNYIDAGDGSNTITTGKGKDTIIGGVDADTINAGGGNDSIIAGDGKNIIDGGAGNDTIYAGAGDDSITSSSGNNYINAGNGFNKINSGSGNDTIYAGEGDDSIISLAGNNYIDAGDGSNTITTGKGKDTIYAGEGDDLITSSSGNNYINAGDGNNTINSGAGSDTIYTGLGNDSIISLSGNNYISAGNGLNTITTDKGNDTIIGGADVDIITSGYGNDSVDGGGGADIINLGAGNDTIVAYGTEASITDTAGIDTIMLASAYNSTSYTLDSTFENLSSELNTSGVTLGGNSGINTITSGDGNDTLIGSVGGNDDKKDVLKGGAGNDTYVIYDLLDSITDTAGVDTIKLDATFDNNPKSTTDIVAYNLSNSQIEAVDASDLDESIVLTGNTNYATTLTGSGYDDTISGGVKADALYGNAGNDSMYGGNDTLADTLDGGAGNDTFLVVDANDSISGGEGNDTIKLISSYKTNSYDLNNGNNSGVETLDASALKKAMTLTGTLGSPITILGGIGADTIVGGNGIDSLLGGAGNDSIVGGKGNDHLFGEAGNDTLYGSGGTDVLDGGDGNDTYIIDDFITDSIVDSAGASDTLKFSSNFSTTGSDFTVGVNMDSSIENIDASLLSNSVTLHGNSSANVLTGSSTKDFLYGEENDTLIGGGGSDEYYVTSSSTKIIEEATKLKSLDSVFLDASFNSSSYSVGAYVEYLDATLVEKAMTLTGSGTNASIIHGTKSYNDKIIGGLGNDTFYGGGGDDTISSGAGDDSLYGEYGKDYLIGSAGDDWFFGGDDTLADTLNGGYGNDEYSLNDSKDVIIDLLGGNVIRLSTSFSDDVFDLTQYTSASISMLDAHHVEDKPDGLVLIGDRSIKSKTTVTTETTTDASGNTVTTTVTATAKGGVDTLIYATNYDDVILSFSGNDTLHGANYLEKEDVYGFGDDTFYGGKGTNILVGGVGDDVYLIDGLADSTTITEEADIKTETETILYGTDTVKIIPTGIFDDGYSESDLLTTGSVNGLETFSYTLSANVENFDGTLITTTGLDLSGNDLINLIVGGAGDDTLYGAQCSNTLEGTVGTDTLQGGAGDDTYKISIADEETVKGNEWKGADAKPSDPNPKVVTSISDTSGNDTILLIGKGSYDVDNNEFFKVTLAADIENLDASDILTDLTLYTYGNALNNTIIGGKGYDIISTYDGNDEIYDYESYTKGPVTYYYGNDIDAGEGNNTVWTGVGSDYITAGSGNDFVLDFGGNNYIDVGNGNNKVDTSTGKDTILSGTGNDYIMTGDNDDYIDAGKGNDTLVGGAGNDTYIVYGSDANNKEIFIENVNAGSDTVQLHEKFADEEHTSIIIADGSVITIDLSTSIYANIENASAINSNSTITVTLNGNDDANILTSGKGTNILTGREGDDTYVIYKAGDTVTEVDGEGSDTLSLRTDTLLSSLNLADYNSIENIDCSSSSIFGLTLTGNDVVNTIVGGSSDDTLNGAGGKDSLTGGEGDDVYYIDNTLDFVYEAKDTKNTAFGNDTLYLTNYSSNTITLANYANVENVYATDITHNMYIVGSSDSNILYGGSGVNTLIGGAGDDIYIINNATDVTTEGDNEGSDTLSLRSDSSITTIDLKDDGPYVNIENVDCFMSTSDLTIFATNDAQVNYLAGGTGSDTIYGYGGNDTLASGNGSNNYLYGGTGNDLYIVGSSTDIITESSGTDAIAISYGLTSLDLSGYTAIENIDCSFSTSDLTLTGDSNNNTIYGGAGADVINTGGGDDAVYGNAENDQIHGGIGNDTIYGGTDNDVIYGSDGANLYGFNTDDGHDDITSTNSADKILISDAAVDKSDILFYSDAAGNFYIDYTDDAAVKKGLGSDRVTLATGSYDSATTIQLGTSVITVSAVLAAISQKDADTTAIAAFNLSTEASQASTLASVWKAA